MYLFRTKYELKTLKYGSFGSDVDDPGELLHPVEEDVSLLYGGLVLSVLGVWSISDDDATDLQGISFFKIVTKTRKVRPYLVDPAMQPPVSNEPRELPVHVLLSNVEGLCHVLEGEAPVGLQQLGERLDLKDKNIYYTALN